MEQFHKKDIDQITKECLNIKKKLDSIVDNSLETSREFKEEAKKRNTLLTELKFFIENAILIHLEKELIKYPV